MTDTRDLEQVRADIDAIDQEIQALISRRAGCAQRVAEIKMAEVLAARERGEPDTEVVYYRPEREAQVLTRMFITARNGRPRC
jgi:chorismate mutase/prephenate dehydratase